MRRLLTIPVILLVVLVLLFVVGIGAQLPFLMVISLMCLTPCFLISLGFAFGKASNQYRFIVPKEGQQVIQNQRARRPTASSYPVGNGEV